MMSIRVLLLSVTFVLVSCSDPGGQADGPTAPLFDDLGEHGYQIRVGSEAAQQYFDQGLNLMYGFNHHEAIRAFREAARLDPDCAMCDWGQAAALGPNINKAMDDADIATAYALAQSALEKSAASPLVEQALIGALAVRYDPASNDARADLDRAYADAMRDVAAQFPDDHEVQTLFAEALMTTMPWDYYREDGAPKPATVEVIAALESVLAGNPDHPGAIHFYIHAVEATDTPDRAEPYADRLRTLVPGAGHLVHMPSHIYLRVGRYADASQANVLAASADESYIAQCKAQGFYPATYYPHNIHFLWYTSAMEGRRDVSIAAARNLYDVLPLDQVDKFREVEYFVPIPLLANVRFGQWEAIRAAKRPPERWLYASAMWHYAQGLVKLAGGDPAGAGAELAALEAILADERIDSLEIPFLMGKSNAAIARDDLAAQIALVGADPEAGIALLHAAIEKQDALPYTEPPYWFYPIRQRLGAALLAQDRSAEAEAVYREDLAVYRHNGWSLSGLAQSLREQGKGEEAAEVEAEFTAIWLAADVSLAGSMIE
ncbi:MAG: hypothetical protein E2O52_03375 [Gammaproteobacteria bacterium]|nr:MAG: hypothetical protein E2O52_03375 [Gammaproteobacteria bacterium]